ncbi:tyrosine/serine/threonine protein phosphatase-like protein 2 [Elsinoe australis]|uniref:Tyrosine/serine/threonine protein phosphatase-like protein 2 n=1 Tax=Elsinoe australis TaxID=40998 RepID=A0A4U7ATR6_9PEZI|nr:tyrosine/serine/threonine protein phosphatase-like protein 2 [Elsinoe australis]
MNSSPEYLPSATFHSRVPSPPRIHIPAPLPDTRTIHESIPYLTPPTGLSIAQVSTSASMDWSYNQRRSAQQILPHLYLGPISAAKDARFLASTGITLVLGIRGSTRFAVAAHQTVSRLAEAQGIASATAVADGLQDLIAVFAGITGRINEHVAGTPGAKVLLFCESGNDRSAGACAAYLMKVLDGVDHIKAMQLVQSQRFCANFDDGLKRLLQGYWDIVRAEREVGWMGDEQWMGDAEKRGGILLGGVTGRDGSGVSVGVKKGKRGREVEDHAGAGGEMEVDEDDRERFGGRTFVPYVDI